MALCFIYCYDSLVHKPLVFLLKFDENLKDESAERAISIYCIVDALMHLFLIHVSIIFITKFSNFVFVIYKIL